MKLYRNTFRGKISKSCFNNKRRAAMTNLRRYIKKNNIQSESLKLKHVILAYANHIGENIDGNPQEWLMNRYLSDDPNLRMIDQERFYQSGQWKQLRKKVLSCYGEICMRCKSIENIHVDHIYPRSTHKELELRFDNMQVLCRSCNSSKSNRTTSDYRRSCYHNN